MKLERWVRRPHHGEIKESTENAGRVCMSVKNGRGRVCKKKRMDGRWHGSVSYRAHVGLDWMGDMYKTRAGLTAAV